MRYSRTGIVAVLLAAEVFLGGAILWTLRGGHWAWPASANTIDINRMSEQSRIDAGQAPHVVVNDPNNRVVITASSDGLVHVTDHTHRIGWFWGPLSMAALSVSRTSDGVAITRGDGQSHANVSFFGVDFQQTEVAVPPQSSLEIRQCDGVTVTGVQASGVKIACDDGSLHFSDVQSPEIDAVTKDGSIHASGLRVNGGRLETGDGSIRLAVVTPNLLVHAQTGDGSIRVNGERIARGDSGVADYQIGTGGGSLRVSTQDGSIHIDTNGAL